MGRCRSCTRRIKPYCAWLLLVLANLVALGPSSRAQTVEINPTISSTVAPLPADDQPSGHGLFSGQLGEYNLPFQFSMHLALRGANDDNIALTERNRLEDWFVQIQPSVMFGVGDVAKQQNFLQINYLPSFYRYEEHPEFDSNQHVARIVTGFNTSNLAVRLSQDIAILNNIVLAAATGERESLVPSGRTNLDLFNTDLSANYNMTPRDFIFWEFRMARTAYEMPLISSAVYATDLYLNHGFTDKFALGLGVAGGYNAVDFPTPNQTMVQALGHLNYTPGNEFSIDIIAGEEFRDFENNSRGTYSTPVFSIGAIWRPVEETNFTLSATRQIYNSAAQTAQDYVDTNIGGMIRQRVCKAFYLAVLGGYEHVQYFNAIDLPMPLPEPRNDYYYVQPSADLILTRFWSFGGYYLRRQNYGTVAHTDFYSNQFGVRSVIKF